MHPVADSNTLGRFVIKSAGCIVRDVIAEFLSPIQLGYYDVKGGAEVALHGARLFCKICDV